MKFRKQPLAVSLALLGLGQVAIAEEAVSVEAITVTAQSRSQQSQAVPIPLQVLTRESVEKLGATNLADMNGYIPGLTINAVQATQPDFSLRGLGASDFGIGTDSPVGVYVDGVATGKTGGSLMNFNDVQRIEVLKGPQGTLFGRNSAAGAIAIVSNEPDTLARSASGRLRLGQHGERQAEVLLNQPLSEQQALRFSAVRQQSDGWLTDAGTGERLNPTKNWGSRLSYLYQPDGAGKLVLAWEHEELDQKARPAVGLVALGKGLTVVPPLPSSYVDPFNAPVYNDAVGNHEGRIFDGVTLRYERNIAGIDFKSTTAFRRFHSDNRQDNDGTNRPDLYLSTANLERNRSWQQEFRFAGKQGMADWVAGVSAFSEHAEQASLVDANTSTLDTLSGNAAGLPVFSTVAELAGLDLRGLGWAERMDNVADNRAYAAYGDVIWHLSPAWNLTTGLRYTRDSKDFSWYLPQRVAPGVDAGHAALTAAGFYQMVAAQMGQAVADQLQGFLTQNQLLTSPGASNAPLKASNSWSDLSPRLVLDYHLDAHSMVYGSVSKGYQAGGYNALQQIGSKFDPETVWNYELGIKQTFPQSRLQLNASIFSYRFSNLQSLNLVNVNQSGVPQYQVTVGDQKAHGVDFDLRWQASRALRLSLAGEYIDQQHGHNVTPNGRNLSGQPTGTPNWNVSAGLDYLWQDVLGGQLGLSLQTAWTSAVRCNDDSEAQGRCLKTPRFTVGEAQQRSDLRLRWDAPGKRWHTALLVSNLFDKRYVSRTENLAQALGSPYGFLTAPRVVAVEVGVRM
ncbi:TonB-dependent receptor [Chitinimonas sp.]|uniref:TonB-dependent receptor n=1 Tax=Chitinimonas sp. TaxID=1934313 RepID=UPI0035B2B543